VNSFLPCGDSRIETKVCLDYLVDQFNENSLDFRLFSKLRVFYDLKRKRLVSLDNRRLTIAKLTCSTAPATWEFCSSPIVVQWATPLEIYCTANAVDLTTFEVPGLNKTCSDLGYYGNHWTSINNGTTLEIRSGANAQLLKCSPWYTNRTMQIFQLNPIWEGVMDPTFFNGSEMLQVFAPTNPGFECGEIDFQVTNGGTFLTVQHPQDGPALVWTMASAAGGVTLPTLAFVGLFLAQGYGL